MATYLARWIRVAVVCAAIAATATQARALSAHECMQRLEKKATEWSAKVDTQPGCISDGVCGAFPEPSRNFYERLSPQCSTLMEGLRSPWSKGGMANVLSGGDRCVSKWMPLTQLCIVGNV